MKLMLSRVNQQLDIKGDTMAEIYEWVRNIVIYLILNTIIMNLLGNSNYKKYVSIVSGMILLLIVISPFLNLLKLDEILDYYLNANIYKTDVSDYKNKLIFMEEKQKETVFNDLKARVKNHVSELLAEEGLYLYDFDIVINQDENSGSYGKIEAMDIVAGYKDTEEEDIPVQKIIIDRIVISDKEKNHFSKEGRKGLPSPEEINIKNKLSDFYNMEQDNINISIQGG